MSNSLAIATVTAALQAVLQPVVGNAVKSATVSFNRPDVASTGGATPGAVVNVYLYQVTPNAAYRNSDLPTRTSDGTLARRPQLALDLHYLFTFHGDDTQLEPQLLLGAVTSTLHAQPLLSSDAIAKAITDFESLKASDLANQVERVKFTPTALSLEEFSKLWSVFFQIEYTLSTVYQASVVLIESPLQPVARLPVKARNVSVVPFREPHIDQVIAQAGADQPIVTGSTLLIQGVQLTAATTLVLLESQEFTPTVVTDAQITLPLPATIHAGVKALQVIQKTLIGTPPALHRSFASNVAPFVLRPTITAASAAPATGSTPAAPVTAVTLTVTPNIGQGQSAILLLNNPAATPPTAFTSGAVIATTDSSQVVIEIAGVPTGKYLVRVQIDGAASLLNATFSGPTVAMP